MKQEYLERTVKAAECYIRRRDRLEHPTGTFDKAGRFWPAEDGERCDCCGYIRTPSRAYPYSLMKHCRSINHVANKFDINATELRRAVKALDKSEHNPKGDISNE